MKYKEFFRSFSSFAQAIPSEELHEGSRYLFLSDLHLGDGSKRDAMRRNRGLLLETLARWYAERDYSLVLNGDIEELSKFSIGDIRFAWSSFFGILDDFASRGKLRKIVGNHDLALLRAPRYPYPLIHGLALGWKGKRILAFHGQQASRFFVDYDYVSEFMVRYLAKPLRIRDASVSSDYRRKYKAERRIYKASKRLGAISITGHTHRPLFASLSKYESLRLAIEDLLREYETADSPRRLAIAESVALYKAELGRLSSEEERYSLSRSLYEDRDVPAPCLFNSGCATGKRGYTAIEIEGSDIELVHWGSAERCRRYILEEAVESQALGGTEWTRYLLKRAPLDQVFSRIELLGSGLKDEEEDDDDIAEAIAAAAMNAVSSPML
jgi:UDP-2,3-diacylglucosamine pyrophosphatase LpxH